MSYIRDMTTEQIKNKIIGQTCTKELLDTYDWEGYYPYVKFDVTPDGGKIAVITAILNMNNIWNTDGCINYIVIDADNEYARDATDEEIECYDTYGDWPNTVMQ